MITQESTSCALEGTAAAERDKVRRNKDPYATQGSRRSRQPAIHTTDTTSVRHTVSLTCQEALANTGQHRGQSQTGDASQTGREWEKEPLGYIYHHACYPEPNQGTNAWPLLIFQNFAYAVLSTQDGHQDKTSGRCHFFHHSPSSEGACFRTRGRTCKWLTCGKICLWPRFKIIILAFR